MFSFFKNSILFVILTLFSFSFSQDCVEDDPNGDLAVFGVTCDQAVNAFGLGCDGSFGAIPLLSDVCPVSCGGCGDEDLGCSLAENSVYLAEDGTVFYNSLNDISSGPTNSIIFSLMSSVIILVIEFVKSEQCIGLNFVLPL